MRANTDTRQESSIQNIHAAKRAKSCRAKQHSTTTRISRALIALPSSEGKQTGKSRNLSKNRGKKRTRDSFCFPRGDNNERKSRRGLSKRLKNRTLGVNKMSNTIRLIACASVFAIAPLSIANAGGYHHCAPCRPCYRPVVSCRPICHHPVRVCRPVCQTPVYTPRVCETPVYTPPVCQTPVYTPPVCQTPVYTPPVCETPVYTPPVYTPPARVCECRPVCVEKVYRPVCVERVYRRVCVEKVYRPVCERVYRTCVKHCCRPVCHRRCG